jgi:hypothetical protein
MDYTLFSFFNISHRPHFSLSIALMCISLSFPAMLILLLETLAMKGLFLSHMDQKADAYEFVKKGLRCDLFSPICKLLTVFQLQLFIM